ncbi:phospholipase A [Desulfogranum japonicum]|uniref:phospholipase A n=1 Tax=Desulfogranum japonicum TaxID=231447 RepID=UPI0004920DA6|nr:phospholipase A [Desulfogranum japonicum]
MNRMWLFSFFCICGVVIFPLYVQADTFKQCLYKAMETAADDVTMGQLRERCQNRQQKETAVKAVPEQAGISTKNKIEVGVVEERVKLDNEHVLEPFTLMAHKPNYLLFFAHNSDGYNEDPFNEQYGVQDVRFDDMEAQFQLSVKFPLMTDLFGSSMDIYAAYTNRSFWQVFNDDISSPFRETNHEPEVWLQFHPEWNMLGFNNTLSRIGFSHQSNGQGGTLSRSWNRVYANITLEHGNLALGFKPWVRIPESEADDDNPDISDYMGHCELLAAYRYKENVFSLMTRNNIESEFSKGAVQLSWSFPLLYWPYLRGYVQYFNGYGESLIDYNQHTNRIGIGVSLTDWL